MTCVLCGFEMVTVEGMTEPQVCLLCQRKAAAEARLLRWWRAGARHPLTGELLNPPPPQEAAHA